MFLKTSFVFNSIWSRAKLIALEKVNFKKFLQVTKYDQTFPENPASIKLKLYLQDNVVRKKVVGSNLGAGIIFHPFFC